MPRENAEQRSIRYLIEGRISVDLVERDRVRALARGDGKVYRLGWDRTGGWWCECPARTRCAHLLAVGRVVTIDGSAARLAASARAGVRAALDQARAALDQAGRSA
jgi:hypothetical protein